MTALLRLATLPLLACLLLAASSAPADAQVQLDKRSAYMIHIFDDAGVCRYQIEDYPDQDTFLIEPHGWVSFYATGTGARIDMLPDQANNQATDGASGLKIKDGEDPRNVRVRPAGAGRTEHDVAIRCCDPRLFGRCVNERDAVPIGSATGQVRPLWQSPDMAVATTFDWVGLGLLSQPSAPPMPEGGPRMIVED